MAEETTNSGVVETEASTTETVEAETGAPVRQDEYQERVEKLLQKHEKQQEQQVEDAEQQQEAKLQSYDNMTLDEGESWDSIFNSQPDDVKRAMGSLRADYTRKMQALSQERRKVEDLQSSLTNSEAFKALQSQAAAAAAEGQEFDPFDNASMSKYIDGLVAKKLQTILEPMYQEQMKAQSNRRVETFMNEHPDLQTDEGLRKEVYEVLQNNEELNLEQGYWIVKGKRAKQNAHNEQIKQQQQKQNRKAVATRISNGKKAGLTAPPNANKMSGPDLYQYLLAQKK